MTSNEGHACGCPADCTCDSSTNTCHCGNESCHCATEGSADTGSEDTTSGMGM